MSRLILVIEDDPDQPRLLERRLASGNWRVVTAPDGEAGLAAVGAQRPDAVVLDVMMPRFNGYQTCRRLRADPDTARIPVIICTTSEQPVDEVAPAEIGADAYVPKPVDVRDLLQVLERLVNRP